MSYLQLQIIYIYMYNIMCAVYWGLRYTVRRTLCTYSVRRTLCNIYRPIILYTRVYNNFYTMYYQSRLQLQLGAGDGFGIIQCTMYTARCVHYTLYNVQCRTMSTLYIVHCTPYTVYNVHYTYSKSCLMLQYIV